MISRKLPKPVALLFPRPTFLRELPLKNLKKSELLEFKLGLLGNWEEKVPSIDNLELGTKNSEFSRTLISTDICTATKVFNLFQ